MGHASSGEPNHESQPTLALSLATAAALLSLSSPAAAQADNKFRLFDQESEVYYDITVTAGDRIRVDKGVHLTGDLVSNGEIDIKRGATVVGDVTAVDDVKGGGTVEGSVVVGARALLFPDLGAAEGAAEALRALADRVFVGDRTFVDAVIDDIIFVDGTARFEGSLNGVGTIIATRDIRTKGPKTKPGYRSISLSAEFGFEPGVAYDVTVTIRDARGRRLVDVETASFLGADPPSDGVDANPGEGAVAQ